jgi:hypothetical protein
MQIKTDNPGLVKDMTTRAVINIDSSAREEARQKHKVQKELIILKGSVEQMQNDLAEIKQMLSVYGKNK